jgi:putative DNA-invertase from lambdoid prophage Rac
MGTRLATLRLAVKTVLLRRLQLHRTIRRLMDLGVRVECTLNGIVFDGNAEDSIEKATRDAVLAFMAAQSEAYYLNRAEMQRRGVAIAKAN